jgi:acyl-CoA thioesterase-1
MKLFRITFPAAARRRLQSRSYGHGRPKLKPGRAAALALAVMLLAAVLPAGAQQRPLQLVLLGDSLTAGLGLPAAEALPARLSQALQAKGIAVEVIDAGVSGDTASAGQARLDWSVPEGADAVVVELGANDALRGVDPKVTRAALDAILRRLKERGIAVLLAGMRAPRNLGEDYIRRFDSIYPELARAHGVLFYPFFLDGVAAEARLNQRDGIHPNAAGVDVIVQRLLPQVEELLARARTKPRS